VTNRGKEKNTKETGRRRGYGVLKALKKRREGDDRQGDDEGTAKSGGKEISYAEGKIGGRRHSGRISKLMMGGKQA